MAVSSEEASEVEVLSRAFAEDASPEVLRQAYERWGGLVYALACRAMPAHDAEDVVQQTFVSVWRSRQSYDPASGPLGAWIVTIARRRIADHWKARSASELAVDPETLAGALDRGEGDPVLDAVQDSLTVQEELEHIGEPQRTIVRLAVLEDRSTAWIADSLAMPVGTVKSHLSRALRRLRDRWEETHAASA
ncbi:sigma-70 family RNA polymerase sigma factor [Agrococcus sediminis]|uniref:RNA polymerase sigma factor n=1 Tax=Agrococcus sediminis TaxID=2599924 RepID=A0A5M8QAH1_9MICO|nr:sigma-70 family RNA polymerase sigma factor [Agrococcus sediminis]RWR19992.1 sigma-70 family RNA polymerase sigma factor [Agrococcus lahaulensis]